MEVTGVYDEQTIATVKKFQADKMWMATGDGFVGPYTAREVHVKLTEG
jgi:hypothetical protein